MQLLNHYYSRWACALIVGLLMVAGGAIAMPEHKRPTADVVRAGVLNNWPPQYQLDAYGSPTGFAIDIIERVAAAASLQLQYTVFDSWEDAHDALRNGKIDLIPNMGITEERKRWFAFTSPAETFPIVIFIRQSTLDISGEQELTGHVVAAVQANVGKRLMQQRSDIELTIHKTLEEAFFELLAGHADALIYPKPVLLKLAMDTGLDEHIKIAGQPLLEIKRAISVRRDDHDLLVKLDSALKTVVPSKAYGQIYAKWYGRPKPFLNPKRIALIMAAMLFLASLIGFTWHYIRTTAINRRLRYSIRNQKHAEEALRVSEEKYRMIVECQRDLIVKLDPEYRILFASPSIHDLVGCVPEDIIGTNLLSLVHSQDYDNAVLAMQSLLVAPYYCRCEVRLLTSRSWKWFAWSNKAVLDLKGQLKEIIAVGRDTTRRKEAEFRLKESEEKFRAIFEHAADSVMLLDADSLAFLDFNATAHQTLGYTKEEFKRVNLKDLLVVEPPDTIPKMVQRILSFRQFPVDAVLRTKSGSVRYYRIKQQTIKLNGDRYLLGVWHDITDRKQLEEHLVRSQKMEAIGTLAGGVAHDFNNIIAIIIGNAELAMQDLSDTQEPLKQKLAEIQTASRRAKDVVAQLRSFSRRDETQSVPILLAPVIEESMQLLRASIPATIEFRKNICSRSLTVLSDSTQIQQVLINLCTNAGHAMAAAGGVLTVSLAPVDLDRSSAVMLGLGVGAYARMTIEDTGSGIDPAIKDRIFDPYFTTKQAHLGTGMGLAMVHGIITKFGGAITVDSRLGHGSRFEVFLPLSAADAAVEAPQHDETFAGHGRLLFVDDEPSILNLGAQYLSQIGYEVQTVNNARAAIELFKSNPDRYDLIVTDLTMPEISGDMMVKEIFKINPHVPVVMCSGFHNETVRKRILSLGIKSFLHKPYQMRTLAKAIKQELERSRTGTGDRLGRKRADAGSLGTGTE